MRQYFCLHMILNGVLYGRFQIGSFIAIHALYTAGLTDRLGRVYHPVSTLVAIWDAHVKDMGKAVCGSSSSWSLTQEVTSDMKFRQQRPFQNDCRIKNVVACNQKVWNEHLGGGGVGFPRLKFSDKWYEFPRHPRYHFKSSMVWKCVDVDICWLLPTPLSLASWNNSKVEQKNSASQLSWITDMKFTDTECVISKYFSSIIDQANIASTNEQDFVT